MKYDKYLLTALMLAGIARLTFFFSWHEIWWDAGVYIGMGKHLFSLGSAGLWEHIRPPLLPSILGFFWWIGLDPVLFGRILELGLTLGIVYFVYSLGKDWNKHAAFIAAILTGFSPILFYLSFHTYTEIPAVFFVLLGIWLHKQNKPLFCGLAIGLAFLTKFPAGIFLIPLLIMGKNRARLFTLLGFSIVSAPYFLANMILYSNPIAPLLAARDAISRAVGCNVLRYHEWHYYFTTLVASENILNVFAIAGAWLGIRHTTKTNHTRKHTLLITLCAAIPLLYFLQLHCRDYRYLALFYPFIALLAGYGIATLMKDTPKQTIAIVLVGITVLSMTYGISFTLGNERSQPGPAEDYYKQVQDLHGTIWISNPITAAYTDAPLNKIYYPIYDQGVSITFFEHIKKNRPNNIMLDNCGGGIICAPDEEACTAATHELLVWLDSNYNLTYEQHAGRCWYRIYIAS